MASDAKEGPYIVDPGEVIQDAIAKALEQISDLTLPFNLITRSWFKTNKSIFILKSAGLYAELGGMNPKEVKAGQKLTNRKRAENRKEDEVGFIYPILKRHGLLEKSMTNPSDSNAVSFILNKQFLVLGTKAKSVDGYLYPAALQAGSKFFKPRPHIIVGLEQVSPKYSTPAKGNTRGAAWAALISGYVIDMTSTFAEVRK